MKIFDIGLYDGKDTDYYLARGHQVVAFEANPVLCEKARTKFASAITAGRLEIHECGIGRESGEDVEFFLHNESGEWSTFYREAAINWGEGKSTLIKVPCITPAEMFARFGVPDYVKTDIEGYDIVVADELQKLAEKPRLVSFEASDRRLPRSLAVAGYQSYKLVDQARVRLQVVRDAVTSETFHFTGGSGPFGDEAEGRWLSFENVSYLYHRFALDPFSATTPPGHWFDLHASLDPAPDTEGQQRQHLMQFIGDRYKGHCGMQFSEHRPVCPVANPGAALRRARMLAWKMAVYRRIVKPVKSMFGR